MENGKENKKETQHRNWKEKLIISTKRKFKGLLPLLILLIIFKYKKILNMIIILIITLIIISTISIMLIVALCYRYKKKEQERAKIAGFEEEWNDLYGEKIMDIPYDKNDEIKNSFKKNGVNYNEEIGDINNGKDYPKNDRNYYNLFIPYSSTKKKDKYNGIILFIHGGSWLFGEKENIQYLTVRYAKCGYITAEMNHTFLYEKYEDFSMFRILDEVTACVESIKEVLKNKGFDENKLELGIYGFSSGAHIVLLYGYSIKNIPLPLKFIINSLGLLL